MGMYYDKEGIPIDLHKWGELMQDNSYRLVKHTVVGPYLVSTVWLGLDHNFLDGPPLIFETMVFKRESDQPWHDLDQDRFSTEVQALAHHDQMVTKWRDKWLKGK